MKFIFSIIFTCVTFSVLSQITSSNLQFFGEGNIQKSLNGEDDLPANTGIGVFYQKKVTTPFLGIDDLRMALSINVASSTDTISAELDNDNQITNRRDFGAYVLVPGNSKQGATFDLRGYFKKDAKLRPFISGLDFNFIGSNRTISIRDTIVNASVIGFSAGVFHDFAIDNDSNDKTDFSIILEANLLFRGMYGDLGQRGVDRGELRKRIFGVDRVPYWGAEIKAGFKLNNILAELSVPMLYAAKGQEILGLTNLQFVTTIKFVGGFQVLRTGTTTGKIKSPLL